MAEPHCPNCGCWIPEADVGETDSCFADDERQTVTLVGYDELPEELKDE